MELDNSIYKKIKYRFIILNMLLFFTFFFISIHPRPWGMHHVVLSFPFLVLALFYIYSKLNKNKLISILLIAFLIINFNLYYSLTKLKPQQYANPSILKINKQLNEQYTDQYVFTVIDWGMYYIKALYGKKNQCVLYTEPFNRMDQAIAVKQIPKELERRALFVARTDSISYLSLIKQNFPDIIELQTNFDTGE